MFTISGKIKHKESGLALPDLLVVLYDVDKIIDPEFAAFEASGVGSDGTTLPTLPDFSSSGDAMYKVAERLGSALTDLEGNFQFEIDPPFFQTTGGEDRKPDLCIMILAPEEPGLDLQKRILYISKEIRLNSGVREAYLIKLDSKQLSEKGVPLPNAQTQVQEQNDSLSRLEDELKKSKVFRERKKQIFKENIVSEQQAQEEERSHLFLQPFLNKISKVPEGFRESSHFVKPGASVFKKAFENIRGKVGELFDPGSPPENKNVKGFIYLTKEQLTRFESYLDPSGTFFDLPDDIIKKEILPLLFRSGDSGSASDFSLDHPLDRLSRNEENEQPGEGGGTDPSDTQLQPATDSDILLYLSRQMQAATAPEEPLELNARPTLEKRATSEDVHDAVARTVFQKGPADVPAYYEFNTLKIAFEHVWEEAIDKGLIEAAQDWYDKSVANGKDPEQVYQNFVHMMVRDHRDGSSTGQNQSIPAPGAGVVLEFPEVISIWSKITPKERQILQNLSVIILSKYHDQRNNRNFEDFLEKGEGHIPYLDQSHIFDQGRRASEVVGYFKQKGKDLVEAAQERIREAEEIRDEFSALEEANKLTKQLEAQLKSKYSFKYYAANATERSVNFGMLLTYQQKWEPLNYQAGELVKTIPMAPRETSKYSRRILVKKHHSEKREEEVLRLSKSDSADTLKAESEIINKAQNKTSFDRNTTTTGGISEGPIKADTTVTLNHHNDAARDSQQTKKDMRQSVLNASQEYKQTHKLMVTEEVTSEEENTESGEISNPNDELTVTYLFYELQRQFKISERLYRMRPVVLVAQEMPAPHDITEDWILSYDWILKRVLLDDSFRFGFDCIYMLSGEKLELRELERTVKEQRRIVKDLRQNVRFFNNEVGLQNRLMQAAILREAKIAGGSNTFDSIPLLGDAVNRAENVVKGVGEMFGIGSDDDGVKEAARIRREAATAAYDRAERERRELMARLENENSSLNALTKELAGRQKEIIEKEIHVARLKDHIKDNILFYMQSIWQYEYRDQRYFRLLDTKVPTFDGSYQIKITKAPAEKNLNDYVVKNKTRHAYSMQVEMQVGDDTLKEVADLDNLLGYKGNYMIFGLKRSNVLTDFMMAPYLDSEFGLMDPDSMGNWNLDDYQQYVNKLRKELGDDEFAAVEEELKQLLKKLLQDPLRNGDIITIPTGSLFIEALPGSHTILEYFKLAHRFQDVKKVQAQVRAQELENIRYAARVLKNEHEDPKIDKKIVVHGNGLNPSLDVDN